MKGRKPKPTRQKIAEGNPGKRKLNSHEPAYDPALPEPPEPVLSDDLALGEWHRVAPGLHESGVLSNLDAAALGAYCAAFSRWVKAERRLQQFGAVIKAGNGKPAWSPFARESGEAQRLMHQFASEFGLTPVTRSRIHLPAPVDANDPWAALDDLKHARDMDLPEIDLNRTDTKGEA